MSAARKFDEATIRAHRDNMRHDVRRSRTRPSPAHALLEGALELDQLSEYVMECGTSCRTAFSTAETLRMAAEELDARGFGGSITQALEARIKAAETARDAALNRADEWERATSEARASAFRAETERDAAVADARAAVTARSRAVFAAEKAERETGLARATTVRVQADLCAARAARDKGEKLQTALMRDVTRLRRVIAHVLAQVGQAVNDDAGIDLVVRRGKPGATDTLTLAEWQDIALLIADARNTPNQGGQQTPGGDAKLR